MLLRLLLWAGLMLGSASAAIAQTRAMPTEITPRPNQAANSAAITAATNSRIVLSLNQRRLYLYRSDMLVSSYPVAVGTAETPTPQGQFAVSQMIVNPAWQSPWTGEVHPPGPESALGLRWIEFASNQEGSFGFHGTPTLDSIGQAASNGCVRMRNEDVVALFAQIGVGTVVAVQP
ncbi:MAG: L,D-transpeptidase [Phormidesmis sp.]